MVRNPSLLLAAALLVAAAAAVHAAEPGTRNPEDLLTRCVLTPEVLAKADYTDIKNKCGLPLKERCEECPCALVASITSTLESIGYRIDPAALRPADVSVALSLCQAVLLPALENAGVSLQSILDLAGCEKQSSCLSL